MLTWITRKAWRAVAVSKVGAAHVLADIPCQDTSRCVTDAETLIACVADGAGSARYSDKGSRAAVDKFISASQELLREADDDSLGEVALRAFEESRQAVLEAADGNPKEYATTLLGLVATGDVVASVQVGDGAIIVDGEVVTDSHSGEYANETLFITDPDAKPHLFSVSNRTRRVAILTDGLENLALENNGYQRQPHGPFFDPMYRWLRGSDEAERESQLGEFLLSDRVRSKTADDVTLLLAMR